MKNARGGRSVRRQGLLRAVLVFAGVFALLPPWVSTSVIRPRGLAPGFEGIPLGRVRVTKYTHHEGGHFTSTGHRLRPKDEGKVCAISRDWWRKVVKPGDQVWVEGYAQPCVALDTMAVRNRKGFRQRRWVDIYVTDPKKGLDFGIRHSTAYIIRPVL